MQSGALKYSDILFLTFHSNEIFIRFSQLHKVMKMHKKNTSIQNRYIYIPNTPQVVELCVWLIEK